MAKHLPSGMDRRARTLAEDISGNKRMARSTANAKKRIGVGLW
jgi:hypothetical protein